MAANDRKIAFIGLGVMGAGMASRLAENGHDITVYNRTRSKADEVGALGAKVADTPADAAKDADVVMISLADQNVVSKVVFDEDGIFETLGQGSYVLDMSTVTPEFARELNGRAREAGYKHLDTCVLGNPMHARQGELRVMAGGDEADFKAVEPLLEAVGKEVTYLGEAGMGATMKLVLNMLMGVQMPALAEAVVFGERAGLDREKILEMISKSGYSSPVMSFRCAIMGARNFEFAAFKLGLMRKDMMLVLGESQKLGVPMPVSEIAYSMLTAAQQQGLGDLDVAAILAFQERMTGMDYPWPGSAEGEAGG
ncbi:MAG: 3-hydroxyisobutyrate dehydrogenase [Solirubrobacteraceae bacterium]|jgi:3-hydroxyisobutyrate dehydrogenase|nr:3-hydroxyisobutyrate dehydrogenase [Solirubrobacteraceae bacterium]MDX6675569.1 3-hydroxyisobutyrate dehydrogenase [Solirubrobacteraceae bacterium]